MIYHKCSSRKSGFRQVLLLCLLAFLPGPAGAAELAPDYAAIDHIEFFVSNLDRSLAFYTRVFGNDLWKNRKTERRYLVLGNSYMAMEQREGAAIDHICFGIRNFDVMAMHHFLDKQGIAWQDYPSGNDLHVDDRNGIRTQLANSPTWTALAANTASPQTWPQQDKPVFKALGLDEIFLTVANLEVDSLFYSRLLNKTGSLQTGSLWYNIGNGHLRLTQAPVGQDPGMYYFSVLVSNTNMRAAADAVFMAGGIIETVLPDGFSFWDPDGHRVLVHATP